MKPIKILTNEEALAQTFREVLRANNVLETDDPTIAALKIANQSEISDILSKFITQDPAMLKSKERIRKLALHADTVLIIGPTGTGKEILARALSASRSPFLPLNCAAFNETLVESELFGHKKGAFTDAREDHPGVLIAAGEGTVYLDEVDKMSYSIQSKLLRAIQEHEVRPIGSTKYKEISCRFVCSSKVQLSDLVEQGKFLEDLYARIGVFEVETSALRYRWEDVQLILKEFLRQVGKKTYDDDTDVPLSDKWIKRIEKFNVRALESYVRNLVVFGENEL